MGGVEKTLLTCLKNMKNENIDMTILCFQNGGALEADFKALGVRFLYIKKTGMIFFDFIQLLFLLMKHKFDIVHSRFGFTSGGFVLASRLTKTRVFVSLHSNNPSTLSLFKSKKILYKLLTLHLHIHKLITKNLSTKIIGHSKSNLNANYPDWERNSKFKLLYNGVDFNEIDNDFNENKKLNDFVNKEDFVLLHIGSFREQKNHTFLIECFNALNPKVNNYKLILVGSGGLFNMIQEKVKNLELSENVYFAGFDKNINKYFIKSDLFVFPSINEGLANVVIEAQYKKIPVCLSDIPPLYESGYKDYHKYYFSPYDEKAAIKKLNEVINDIKIEKLEESIVNAKEYVVDKFSIQSMVEGLKKLYN